MTVLVQTHELGCVDDKPYFLVYSLALVSTRSAKGKCCNLFDFICPDGFNGTIFPLYVSNRPNHLWRIAWYSFL
jgi:hypothetical protein